jgi:putative ABC transport system permease protein
MLINYIFLAYRNLRKNALNTAINALGLILGFFSFIVISVFIIDEWSYDRWHTDADKVFRLTTIDKALGVTSNMVGITNPMMPQAAADELSEVTVSSRVIQVGDQRVVLGEQAHYASEAKYVEADFFNLFDLEMVQNDAIERFEAPGKLLLTESFACQVFGKSADPVGQLLEIDDENWEVVGTFQDVNRNSHLSYDLLMSMYFNEADSNFANYVNSWNGLGMIGYVKLENPAQELAVEASLQEIALANDVPEAWIPQLQPLKDVHLKSSGILFDGYNTNKGDILYVSALSVVAVLILLIAAFNFTNLTTAQSTTRAKEVGIRKVLGSEKKDLKIQHLIESVVFALLCLAIAFGLVIIVGQQYSFGLDVDPLRFFTEFTWVLGIYLGVAILLGLVAGLYPAFVLSAYDAIKILRGRFTGSSQGIMLRKSLVTLQFVASVVMIIATLIVGRQIDFLRNKELGFSKDQVVNFQLNDNSLREGSESFVQEVLNHPSVVSAGYSSNMPGRTFGRTGMRLEENAPDEEMWIVSALGVDQAYFTTMGIELAEGRNYDESYGADEDQSIIINETMQQELGWEEAVGKKIFIGGERTIVGVVKDFHFAGMRHKIEPLAVFYNPNPSGNLSLKLQGGNIEETLAVLERAWTDRFIGYPFEYQFFDQEFDQIFEADQKFSTLVNGFATLSIVLSCLGLFGLSTYTAEQRRKEIGVRKVLGSSVSQVVRLLMSEFILLIMIASAIAWPISYWALDGWLADFQYRIQLLNSSGILMFGLATLGALAVSMLAIGYKSIQAALSNPVESLRDE